MQRRGSSLIFSPTDLCRFVESRFASWMDRCALEHPDRFVAKAPTEELVLIRRKGREHEDAYLASLIEDGHTPYDPGEERDKSGATLEAMRRGEPMIRQAALSRDLFAGYADLLIRVDGSSGLGGHHYLPRDVKLGLSVKPKYVLQLCAYIDML